MSTILTLTPKGRTELNSILAANGAEGQSLDAWVEDVEMRLSERHSLGETLSVELNGLRSWQGYTIDFSPADDDYQIETITA